MTREISIQNKEQIQRINELACKTPYEVWLSTSLVMLDARSLLGLYSLIGQKVHVVAEDYINPNSFNKLVDKMV